MSVFLRSELGVVCPSCDAYLVPKATDCGACGAKVVSLQAPPPRTSSSIENAAAQWDAEDLEVELVRAPGATPVPPGMKPSRTPPPAAAMAAVAHAQAPHPTDVPEIARTFTPVMAPVTSPVPPPSRPAAAPVHPSAQAPAPTAPAAPPPAAAQAPAPASPAPSVPPPAAAQAPAPASPAPSAPPLARAVTPSGPVQQLPVLTPPGGAVSAGRPAATGPRFGLSVLVGRSRGARFRLPPSGATIGTGRTALMLEDPFVSSHHATLLVREGVLHIRDEGSVSGTFVAIQDVEVLPPGSAFSVGSRLFRYGGTVVPPVPVSGQPTPYGAPVPVGQPLYLVEELLFGGRPGRAAALAGPVITFGFGPGDFTLPQEEGLAVRHCELAPGPASAHLRDLSGGLGTYLRLPPRTERPLKVGERIRVGQHVIQVEAPI